MADIQRRPVKKVRLQQLIAEAGLPVLPSLPPIQDDRTPITYLQQSHQKEATDLLLWRRTWDKEYKPSSFSSKSKETVFGFDEINRAIKTIIDQMGSIGVVEALLLFGKESKASLWGKMKGKEQQIAWAELLVTAIRKPYYEMLKVLASRTDEASLNSVLPHAIRSQDLVATRILLERGADLTNFHADFMSTLSGPNADLAELLITAPRPPCHRCRSDALITTAQNGSLRLAGLLVQRGLDADWQEWAALRCAIQTRRREIVLAIVSGHNPPSPSSLDSALGLLYSLSSNDVDFIFSSKLAEALLCAGAQGENTSNVLIAASRNKQVDLVDLLVSYGASVDFHDGEAIRIAIISKEKQLLLRLLRGKPVPDTLIKSLYSTQKLLLDDLKFAKEVIGNFLSYGLRGTAVDQLLFQIVLVACHSGAPGQDPVIHVDSLEIMRMLMDGNYVDINFQDAASLRAAAGMGCLDVLQILLSKPPISETTLGVAFVEGTKIVADNPSRLPILTALLDAGSRGVVVDKALVSVIEQGKRGMEEARLLLRVASVDYGQGAAITVAILAKELELLDLLLEHHPDTSTIRHVWDTATTLEDSASQLEVFKKLLAADLSAAPLDRELVAAVSRGGTQDILMLLLDHGARVDSHDGLALTAAVTAQNMAALQLLLLERKPPTSTLRSAAQGVWLLSGPTRLRYTEVLLQYGLEQGVLDAGLLAALNEDMPSKNLITMLLDHGASPEFQQGAPVAAAVQLGDPELLTNLISRIQNPESLSNALETLLKQSSWHAEPGQTLLARLLEHGARAPSTDSAFIESCANYSEPAYTLLINYVSSAATLNEALRTIITQDSEWQSSTGLALLELLLLRGASNYAILRPALVQAASMFNTAAVVLLQQYVRDPDSATMAWGEATLTGDTWLSDSGLPVLEALLASGARADVNFALVRTVAASSAGRAEPIGLVDLLLRYGADPNRFGGQPFLLAARNGNAGVLQMFCERGPNPELIYPAFFDILTGRAQDDGRRALECLRALMSCHTAQLDLNNVREGVDPLLIQVLSRFSDCPGLIEFLVHAGADIRAIAKCPILITGPDDWRSVGEHGNGKKGSAGLHFTEDVPALLWALMRPKKELDDSVIEVLIELGADVNFATPHLRFTPLILAAKHDRPTVIAKLLQWGAVRDARDNFHNTALLYASRHGYIDCVKTLLWQNTAVNDGSLHEAARTLQAETVTLLLQAGHDANFASEMTHGGRTPLGELVLLADGKGSLPALDATLHALIAGGADPFKASGQPLMQPIFLALANPDPKPILERFIQICLPGAQLSNPAVLFEQDSLAYSPTTFLKKVILPAAHIINRPNNPRRISSAEYVPPTSPYPADTTLSVDDASPISRAFHVSLTTVYNELLTQLLRLGARDRFYSTAPAHVQPADMAGAPEHITREENARRAQLQSGVPPPPPIPPRPGHRGGRGDDELHLWGGPSPPSSSSSSSAATSTPQSAAQWRIAELERQTTDRRAIAELVNRHLHQQVDLRGAAAKMRQSAWNRARLDREGMRTPWLASQMALAARLGVERSLAAVQREVLRGKERETMEHLGTAREKRVLAHERAREACFVDEIERRVAKRPKAVSPVGSSVGSPVVTPPVGGGDRRWIGEGGVGGGCEQAFGCDWRPDCSRKNAEPCSILDSQ